MRSHLSEGRYFRGDGFFRDMVTPVKFYRHFRRVVSFEIHCETSHANDFVNAKSHAGEKPLLARYSDQFGISCYVYLFPYFLQKKKLHTFEVASFVGSLVSRFGNTCEILSLLSGVFILLELYGLFATLETRGNWVELNFAKTSRTFTRDRKKNWPISDRRVPTNRPRNNCGTHFDSSSLLVSKVANCQCFGICLKKVCLFTHWALSIQPKRGL